MDLWLLIQRVSFFVINSMSALDQLVGNRMSAPMPAAEGRREYDLAAESARLLERQNNPLGVHKKLILDIDDVADRKAIFVAAISDDDLVRPCPNGSQA